MKPTCLFRRGKFNKICSRLQSSNIGSAIKKMIFLFLVSQSKWSGMGPFHMLGLMTGVGLITSYLPRPCLECVMCHIVRMTLMTLPWTSLVYILDSSECSSRAPNEIHKIKFNLNSQLAVTLNSSNSDWASGSVTSKFNLLFQGF